MKKIFILLSIIIVHIACINKNVQHSVYYETSFEEIQRILQDRQYLFCIVLYDSSRISPKEYLNKLITNKVDTLKNIFNFIDITINKNKWYDKLLSPQILPVTCIFTTSGELIDLIPGSSKESVLYLNEVLKTQKPNNEFHYNKKYGTEKKTIINIINNILKLKFQVDNKQNVIAGIDTILTKVRFPYILFLKLQNQLQLNDSIGAKQTAKDLLSFNSAKDLLDYYDELMFANQIIDPSYSTQTAPLVQISPTKIMLQNCKIDKKISLIINAENKGEKPLEISDIMTSCSCVKLISPKKHIIPPKQCVSISFEFTPDVSGNVYREIYIASNSLNTPIISVAINATVN